jgi:hypothetical protein
MAPEELETLKHIEELLAAVAKVLLAEPLKAAMKDKECKFLYQNTGLLPVKKLSQETGFSAGKISGIWQDWENAGLLVKEGRQYRRVL